MTHEIKLFRAGAYYMCTVCKLPTMLKILLQLGKNGSKSTDLFSSSPGTYLIFYCVSVCLNNSFYGSRTEAIGPTAYQKARIYEVILYRYYILNYVNVLVIFLKIR